MSPVIAVSDIKQEEVNETTTISLKEETATNIKDEIATEVKVEKQSEIKPFVQEPKDHLQPDKENLIT